MNAAAVLARLQGVDRGNPSVRPEEAEFFARQSLACLQLEAVHTDPVRFVDSPEQIQGRGIAGSLLSTVVTRTTARTGVANTLFQEASTMESLDLEVWRNIDLNVRLGGPEPSLGVLTDAVTPLAVEAIAAGAYAWVQTIRGTDSTIYVLRRPRVHRDDQERLHNPSGPSISWPGGPYAWHINGVEVPEEIVRRPRSLPVSRITSERNAEVRRVMLERYGFDRYLKRVNAELLDDDPRFGKLWTAAIPGDEPLTMVEVLNSTPEPDGTFKTYFMRVPPRFRRAHAAVAWTFGKTVAEYQPAKET